ncbi:MAG: prolipoprotein diacylglyceryl transferase [Lachnospiraceae bacterium]|nr:prolipoprotein diacylglyceryl transferase [Lachnospiraceae bacterium]
MKDELFKIGSLTVHGYGLMITVGIIAAYLILEQRAKRKGYNPDTAFDMAVCAALGGAIGAKLLYYIVEIKSIIQDPRILLNITNGFVVYGGIIGGSAACIIYCRVKKLKTLEWFDMVLPEIAVAQGFGRIGCLLAGCCYGAETTCPIHIVFKESMFAPNNVWLYPTQIMSSLGNFLNFCLLVFVVPRFFKKSGVVSAFYLIFYSIGRFAIEFFRGDAERGAVGALSTSQFISIFIFAAGVALFVLCQKFSAIPAPVSAEQNAEESETQASEETKETEE